VQDPTSIFRDLSIPRTLAISESISYTLCNSETVTQFVTLYIDGSAVYASPITYDFPSPSSPFIITYNFPDVTLTNLRPLETVLYVDFFSLKRLIF
jgi:hypothetical protein